jgi:hypothetical protein
MTHDPITVGLALGNGLYDIIFIEVGFNTPSQVNNNIIPHH